ncbi:MAG: hypothetical protein JWL70_231, partial [Acidimicrobiia bacterium]|nr:hypothetical protein [Acidimicrobiia bacterium]
TRVLDTRTGPDPRGAPHRLAAGETLVLPLRGRSGVPAEATSVLVNVTAVTPDADGFITAYPCDQPRPIASNLNPAAGQIVANAAMVGLAANGSICLYSLRATDLVVDVSGAYAPGSSTFTALGAVTAGDFAATGIASDVTPMRIGLGAGRGLGTVSAVALDLTVLLAAQPGYVTAYPCDQPRPNASNLNFARNRQVSNIAVVPVGADGSVCVYSSQPVYLQVAIVGLYG